MRTERLVLRPLTAADASGLLGDGRTPTSQAGPGWPTQDDRDLLALLAASGHDGATGAWLVEHEGRVVGTAGHKGPVDPDGDLEIGYGLAPASQGQGLGTEAVAALCVVLERLDGVRRLTAEVLPGNVPSRRLLERLGFEVVGQQGGHLRYARSRLPQPARRIAGRHVC